jgi:hypothetical protein
MGMFDDLIPGARQPAPEQSYGMFADLVPADGGPGDTARGFKVAMGQTVPILKGVAGLVGATGEKAFGEGGISTGLKNWGLTGFTEGMEKLQPLQKDTDELTTAWKRAKDGDLGALIDWAQYGLGYAAGQAGEAVAMSLLGGAVGAMAAPEAAPVSAAGGAITGLVAKGAVKEAATALIRKAVLKEANDLMATSAGKLTAEQAVQQATRAVAKNIGSTSALLAFGGAQELGTIYPEAEAEALKKGESLSGGDLARVWAAGLAAGGVEGLTDKLGIGAVTGKVKFPGLNTRISNAAAMGLGGAATEGLTEAGQTAIERYGAGQEILSPEGQKDIINSAALGALGGGAIGGGSGALRVAERARSDAAFGRIAAAETPDDAIKAFEDTYIAPVLPAGLDAEGALGRMEGWVATDQSRFGSQTAPVPSVFQDGTIIPTEPGIGAMRAPSLAPSPMTTQQPAAPTEPGAQVTPDAPFSDRVLTVQQQLKSGRVRQQIREVMGPQALADIAYYASAADNTSQNIPAKTRDRMLQVAEAILSRAQLQPMGRSEPARQLANTPTTPQPESIQTAPGMAGRVTPPSGVIEVGPDGTATPVTRAGVLVDDGRFVQPEPAPVAEPLALPEPAPYRAPTTPEEKSAAFAQAERDAANARASQAAAIPEKAAEQNQRAAAVAHAAKVDAPTAMQEALARAGLGRVKEIAAAANEAAASPANDKPEPTDAQKEAGNYAKGHVRISGLDVSIETPKGAERRSKADAAEPWRVVMPAHYGYIKGTKASDGDHVDLFIGDKGENGRFWVINQNHPGTGRFDEPKVITGVDSAEEATAVYKASFADNFGDKVFGSISGEFTPAALKARLPSMSRPKPVTGGRKTQEVPGAPQEVNQQGGVQQERGDGNARRETSETGRGDRVQRAEGGTEGRPRQEPVRARNSEEQAQQVQEVAREAAPAGEAPASQEDAPAGGAQQATEGIPGAPAAGVQAAGVKDEAETDATSARPKLDNKAAFADNYRALEGRTLERKVKIADTGGTGTLRMDAAKAMRRLDGRRDALLALRKCLDGSGS